MTRAEAADRLDQIADKPPERTPRMTKTKTRIPCPGKCGGEAVVEPPVTRIKGGKEKTVWPARCLSGECVDTIPKGRGRYLKQPRTWMLNQSPFATEKPVKNRPQSMVLKPDHTGPALEQRVRAAMKQKGLTQKDLAAHLNFPVTALRKWMKTSTNGLRTDRKDAILQWLEGVESQLSKTDAEIMAEVMRTPTHAELGDKLRELADMIRPSMVSHCRSELLKLAAELGGAR